MTDLSTAPKPPADSAGVRHRRPARARGVISSFGGWESSLLLLFVVELVYFSVSSPDFFNGGSGLLSLSQQFVTTGIVALGLAPVVLSGGIDLSVGSTASLSGVVMAALWKGGTNIWLAALGGLLVALLVGLVNGLLVVRGRLEPLIGTLAVGFIATSIATGVAGNSPPYGFPTSFTTLGTGTIGQVPLQLIIFAVLATVVLLLMTRTEFGRSITMIGHSASAARYSGIKVNTQLVRAYMFSSLMAGVAGLMLGAFYSAVRADLGDSLLLPALTMIVLGGVDIFGGRGRAIGVIVAVFALGYLTQGLLISGYSQLASNMVVSVVMLAAIAVKMFAGSAEGSPAEQLRNRLRNLRGSHPHPVTSGQAPH
ncbi:ABC transporter permease [Streptomyces sp. NPDC048415]|uniref:ABC transporter permease n=1 Tax=Streptomyces sp. NPDC048415 TaxID=3154822 RepID=UPI0034302320